MSNEEHLEEILYKAHKKGFYEELFHVANQIQKQNPKIGLYENDIELLSIALKKNLKIKFWHFCQFEG